MPKTEPPDLSLFLDILRTLELIQAPYMIIGAFAATLYGITRTTFDIDIVVNLWQTILTKARQAVTQTDEEESTS